jgi:hypothetical protein
MAARPRKQFARDANIRHDLAASVGGAILQVLRTVVQELTHTALSRRRAEAALPLFGLQCQWAWGLNPFELKPAGHRISKDFSVRPMRKGYVPDGEENSCFILAETLGR